ncbi:MAG: hypothetical protein HY964_07255 [Ignavibacteriales bacterium]|nr:hypothetical protein [Ignavibacteriales bacterium]
MNKKIIPVDLKKIRTIPLKKRKNKVSLERLASVYDPAVDSFSMFVSSLPKFLVADDLRSLVYDIVKSRKKKLPVIVMAGAHVIKVGLSPLIIDLMERKIITALAINGAAAIHDVELAMWGKTSEDVEENIQDGTFGMSKETGEYINHTLRDEMKKSNAGFGEALGNALFNSPNKKNSLLANCIKYDVPVTVHVGIGTDIIHQQPSMNGSVTGEMSFRDFKLFCGVVQGLNRGGVVMNFGSAVILPEVFLKALTVARNLGANASGFTTANFDMIQHYRPRVNVVQRPTKNSGNGYMFTGHHEIMIPLLCAFIKNQLKLR